MSYWKELKNIEHPIRYLGNEFGLPDVAHKRGYPKILMGFPDVYEVGMSHLGFRLLHASLAARSDLQVERVFLPWPDHQAWLRHQHRPLVSLETQTPVAEFKLWGLSLQYELALPSVLKLLDLAHIPRRTSARAASGKRWPILLVGGVGALNPEPLAPFVDCFFIGEADQAIHEIVNCVIQQPNASREVILSQLSRIEGIYLPEFYPIQYRPHSLSVQMPADRPSVQRRYVSDLNTMPLPSVSLVPSCSIVHDRVTIEIQRGCSHGCRFCQAGFVSRPTRQRSAERIIALAREDLRRTGYQDLSLLSLSAGDHPCLQEILAALIQEHRPERVAISLPSLRTETLHPMVAQYLASTKKSGFTLAPEAATERLRRVINKGNTEADLIHSIRTVAALGYAQIKLYFMIGLPTETEEDVLAIADLSQRLMREAQLIRKKIDLTISVSTFVPKPHTPFQWEAAPTLKEIIAKQHLLQARVPRRLRLKWHDPGQSIVEAYLARADRRMANVLERLVTPDYPGMDAWTDHFSLDLWEQALKAAQVSDEIPDPELWLGQRDLSDPLPWEHIDVGVTRQYFLKERESAIAGKTRPDCSDGSCDACGVCPEGPLHQIMSTPSSSAHPAPISTAVLPDEASDKSSESSPASLVNAIDQSSEDHEAEHLPPSRESPGNKLPTFRLWFYKLEQASLISHLEMLGVFERAARRARLPVAYSNGFHPKSRLRFSPALPLGAESRCEFLEMVLQQTIDLDEVIPRLQQQLPLGIELQRGEWVESNILHKICGIHWRFILDTSIVNAFNRVQKLLEQGTLIIPRQGKEPLDIGPRLIDLSLQDQTSFDIICRFDHQGTVRPIDLLEGLFQLDKTAKQSARIIRLDWILS